MKIGITSLYLCVSLALLLSCTALCAASSCVGGGQPCGTGCTLPGGRCINGDCYDSFGLWTLCLPSVGGGGVPFFPNFPMRGWTFPDPLSCGSGRCQPNEFCDTATKRCHADTCPNQFKYGCSGDRSKLYRVECPDSTFTECYESSSGQFRCYRGPGGSEISCHVRGSGSVSSSVSSFGNGGTASTWGTTQAGSQAGAYAGAIAGSAGPDTAITQVDDVNVASGVGAAAEPTTPVAEPLLPSGPGTVAADAADATTPTPTTATTDPTTTITTTPPTRVTPSRIIASAPPESPSTGETRVVSGPGQQVSVSQGPGSFAGGMADGDQSQVITHTGPGESFVSSTSVSGDGGPAVAGATAGGGSDYNLQTLMPGLSPKPANPASSTSGQPAAPLSANDGAAKPAASSAVGSADAGAPFFRQLIILGCALWGFNVFFA